ncbi:MAG: DUF2179 domain-containing protein [Bacteroidales bacterium]|jgi:uncharacterized protein YebE (UPF0316 family)|nr:DUF2179 domain-containing protein [Bacteroidales bacterium]MDD4215182.1 DUF2179 domain-containing protein [Bacteroidales bacterium]
MTILDFLSTDAPLFTWVVLPILIFCARIFDQSVGTLRLIFIAKGIKKWAPVFAFFESLIWLLAIGEIIKHLDNPLCYIAYAGGFAMGNYIGMLLDEKISLGNVIIRVILKNQAPELIAHLKESHYGITILDAEGAMGKVKVIFSIIKRKDVSDFIGIINELNPQSFYTIEEVRSVNEGVFKTSSRKHLINLNLMTKKHK